MTHEDTTPRIWVGCLGCYNAGNLFGYWVDAIDAPESTEEWLAECRRLGQPVADPGIYDLHEELWCFDHENLPVSGECSPSTAREYAEVIEAIENDGFEVEAVVAYFDGEFPREWDRPTREDFQDHYQGNFPSIRDYAYHNVETFGLGGLERVPDGLEPYLDWDLIIREIEMEYTIHERKDYSVDVFSP